MIASIYQWLEYCLFFMDQARHSSGNAEDNVGNPDDLRCKRSDGKQCRCAATSMPDKTVCKQHYIQAKKRAANSSMRTNFKKVRKNSLADTGIYPDSRSDDFDVPLAPDYSCPSGKEYLEIGFSILPTDLLLGICPHMLLQAQRELEEYSDASTDPSEDTGGKIFHQCQWNIIDGVIWCRECDSRGYCGSCASARSILLHSGSLGEASRLAEGVRSLANDLEAKIQVLEVGKISLYGASSSIKVQKLVLDPKPVSVSGFN